MNHGWMAIDRLFEMPSMHAAMASTSVKTVLPSSAVLTMLPPQGMRNLRAMGDGRWSSLLRHQMHRFTTWNRGFGSSFVCASDILCLHVIASSFRAVIYGTTSSKRHDVHTDWSFHNCKTSSARGNGFSLPTLRYRTLCTLRTFRLDDRVSFRSQELCTGTLQPDTRCLSLQRA